MFLDTTSPSLKERAARPGTEENGRSMVRARPALRISRLSDFCSFRDVATGGATPVPGTRATAAMRRRQPPCRPTPKTTLLRSSFGCRCFRNQVLVDAAQPARVLELEPDFQRRSSSGDAGWADHAVADVQGHLRVHADIIYCDGVRRHTRPIDTSIQTLSRRSNA